MFEPWMMTLLDECPAGRLGTIAADGRPHLVPVCFAMVDGAIGVAIDEKPKRPGAKLARVRNLERDGRCTLLVDRYDGDWTRLAWVRVDAVGEVLERGDTWPAMLAALRERYHQYRGMTLEELPLLRLRPVGVRGWRWSA